MTARTRIALPKLFLWSEPSRIQEYPEALARADLDRTYTRVEVERELFDVVPTMKFRGGALRGRRTDGIINAYGLERSGERYRIDGINLLCKRGSGIVASEAGLALGRMFREAPNGDEWPRELARQLLLREPRSRLLVALVLRGFGLEVRLAGASPSGSLALVDPGGRRTTIGQRDCVEFNALLAENAELALGDHWRSDLARLGVSGPVHFEGVQSGEPSTNDLPTALKKALAVLFHVGLLDGDGDRWGTDAGRLSSVLGADLARSFGVDAPRTKLTDDEAFVRALNETVDGDGYVIVSRLADRFGELLDVPGTERAVVLDSFVRGAMYHDRLRVLERHAGQPRMGRGLFGESQSRRVRLDFHADGPPSGSGSRSPSALNHARESTGGDR